MTTMSLRAVSSPAPECPGCSRRAVLQGFAATAATVLVGCPSNALAPADAPTSSATMCGSNLCMDLGDPLNAAITMVGGSLVVNAPSDRILVIRTSTSAVAALSDICTHLGCGVRYEPARGILQCPCHGSEYSLTGQVLQGPAIRPLTRYATQLDTAADQLTITL
jgi:Rieske Fe-S protein